MCKMIMDNEEMAKENLEEGGMPPPPPLTKKKTKQTDKSKIKKQEDGEN